MIICRQHITLIVVFIVALIGFNAYEMHKRGLLVQDTVQLEEIVVTAQPIIIPEVTQKVNSEDLERERRNQEILATAGHNESVLGAAEQAQQLREMQLPPKVTYEVQKGDSLWSIAKNLTGDGENWHELYEQNQGTVGENPDLIFPGQVLTLSGINPAGVR